MSLRSNISTFIATAHAFEVGEADNKQERDQRQGRQYIEERYLLPIDQASDDRDDDSEPQENGHPATQSFLLNWHKQSISDASIDDPKRQFPAVLITPAARKDRGRVLSRCSTFIGYIYYIKCFQFQVLVCAGSYLFKVGGDDF